MVMIYSAIHEKWFNLEPILSDMITETETITSLTELNQVMQRGLCKIKRSEKVN